MRQSLCWQLGFAAAGCASASKAHPSLTVAGTTTTSNVTTGTVVTCRGRQFGRQLTATVTVLGTVPGDSVGVSVEDKGHWSQRGNGTTTGGTTMGMQLARAKNGLVEISCGP